MLYERIQIPVTPDIFVPVDIFCPVVSDQFDPNIQRPSVVICPGGGYSFIAEREAEPVALDFVANGFNAFIVYYRVAPNRFPSSLDDLGAVVAHIRKNAVRYHSHPEKIAVLGFSAGGHLAASISVMWNDAQLWAPLGLIPKEVRPNAAILCYPVLTAGEFTHKESMRCLTGTENPPQQMSLEKLVTSSTPPTFLWHTWSDKTVSVMNTLLYAQALYLANVSAEVHIYPRGPHGLSLAKDFTCTIGQYEKSVEECTEWPSLARRFLNQML